MNTQHSIGPLGATITPAAPITYQVERRACFDHGAVEVGRFAWTTPLQDIEIGQNDAFGINMALSPRTPQSHIARIRGKAAGRKEPISRLVFTSPGSRLRVSVPSGAVRTIQCTIGSARLTELLGRSLDEEECHLALARARRRPAIELLLIRIYDELSKARFGWELAISGYATTLCVELGRCFREDLRLAGDVRKGGLPPWIMRRLQDRMNADGPPPHLAELAGISGLTVRQLGRAFKAETGTTLGKHVEEVVIARACRLLAETDEKVAAIATGLGFANSPSFSHSFRQKTGVSPREFRQRSLL